MTITITDQDLEGIATELESWPYTRAPRLYDLDYMIAVSAAIEDREGQLDSWHEIAGWCSDVAIAYWLLAQEHHVRPYAEGVLEKLAAMPFEPGGGIRGTMKRDGIEGLDAEDFEGALMGLAMLRHLQADRVSPRDAENEE
jgi:hypothetical protein